MALRKCRECEKKVSTEATTCPSCGAPNPTEKVLTSKKKNSNSNKKSSRIIKPFWNGEEPLATSFWGYGWVLNAIMAIPALYFQTYTDSISDVMTTFLLIYFIFFLAFQVWLHVGIWRSATNYAKKKSTWGGLAKIVVFLNVSNIILQLFIL